MPDPRRLSLYFSAGAIGGIVSAIFLWFLAASGAMDHFDVSMKPQFTQEWAYLHLVHGGLWGFLFFIPFLDRLPLVKGLALSLIPTLVTLFVLFPIFQNKGTMGVHLGDLTWAAVACIQAVWGTMAGLWLRWTH